MPVFISYNHEDADFADKLAANLVKRKHHIWIDRWELSVGDSLIERIQSALTESSAIIVILSKHSVASEWCKKELNSGLVRELSEKKVIILPCVIDDCQIPLFLREKLYADFRRKPDEALEQINSSLQRLANVQQDRLESPDFHTDWSVDWKQGQATGQWYLHWTCVDHGRDIEYVILTQCQLACNNLASQAFGRLSDTEKLSYVTRALSILVTAANSMELKFLLSDAFEKFEHFTLNGIAGESWFVEASSRRLGIDNGKDTLVHADKIFEQILRQMSAKGREAPR